jgi:ABC-type transporter Mla subunit MlaD
VTEADAALRIVINELPHIVTRAGEAIHAAEEQSGLASDVVTHLQQIGTTLHTSSSDLSRFDTLSDALRGMALQLTEGVREFRPEPVPV